MKKIRPHRPNKRKKETKDHFFSERESKTKENSGQDSFFQAKLEISDPSSPFEREADAMADHVLQQNNDKTSGDAFGKQSVQRQVDEEEPAAKRIQRQVEEEEPAAKHIQRQAEEEEPAAMRIQRQVEEEEPAAKRIQRQVEEEEPAAKRIQRQVEEEEPAAKRIQRQAEEEEPAAKHIQRKAEDATSNHELLTLHTKKGLVQTKGVSPGNKRKNRGATDSMDSVEALIQETKGKGMPLPEEIKSEMESELKADFSNVRIHIDDAAVQLSAMLNAQAFTHGYDIYFNVGKYDPYSREGKHLLAHELTHVVQQKG